MIKSKQNWILKNMVKCNGDLPPFDNTNLNSGDTVPYLGQHYEIRLNSNHHDGCIVKLENNIFLIEGKCDNGTAAAALKQWLRGQASVYFPKRAGELAADSGCRYNRIYVRSQRTRWGSCSASGNISLNWKLIMFPSHIIDYVIVHELAHLKVMGHSKAFWDVVSAHCPDWRNYRHWLREHEGYLSITI
jgi:predicted metal-dependent hydrolase